MNTTTKLTRLQDDPRYQVAATVLNDAERRRREAFAAVEVSRDVSLRALEHAREDVKSTTEDVTAAAAKLEAVKHELDTAAWAALAGTYEAAIKEAGSRIENVQRILTSVSDAVGSLIAAGHTPPIGVHRQRLVRAGWLLAEALKLIAVEQPAVVDQS